MVVPLVGRVKVALVPVRRSLSWPGHNRRGWYRPRDSSCLTPVTAFQVKVVEADNNVLPGAGLVMAAAATLASV